MVFVVLVTALGLTGCGGTGSTTTDSLTGVLNGSGATFPTELRFAAVANKAGNYVAPTLAAVSAAAKAETLRSFFRFLLTDGQKLAGSVDYAAIPVSLSERAVAQLDRITTA